MSSGVDGLRRAALGAATLDALRQAIREVRAADPLGPITVVTPSMYSSFFLRRRLAREGLFNVGFERLEDVAERLLSAHGDGAPPRLSRLRASEMVYQAANDETVSLPETLARVRGHPSFLSALHNTLDSLRAAPEDAFRKLKSERDANLRAVGELWQRYSALSGGYYDRLSVSTDAAACLERDGLPSSLGRVIYLLAEAPPAQHRPFADALGRQPGVVTIFGATGDKDADALPGLPEGDAAESSEGAPRGTLVINAPDPAGEARWIVRDVLRRAGEGTRFGPMAVFYDDPAYGSRVVEALRASGVPVSGPDPALLSHTPEGRWLSRLLDMAALDGSRHFMARGRVMAWLTGSPVKSPDSAMQIPASRWDAISKAAGVIGGANGWRGRLERYVRSQEHAESALARDEITDARARAMKAEAEEASRLLAFITRLIDDCAPPAEGASWSGLAKWVRGLYERYFDASAAGNDEEQPITALLDRVESLDDMGGAPPTHRRFRDVLLGELEQPVRRPQALDRGVFVAPLREAVGCDFDVVYIPGMSEGRFPSRDSEDPLLPDRVRHNLDPDGAGLPQRRQRRASARRRYLAALAAAPERVLLWPRSEPGARRQSSPAQWLMETIRALAADDPPEGLADPSMLLASELHRLNDKRWFEVVPTQVRAAADTDPADGHEYDVRSAARHVNAGRRLSGHWLAADSGSAFGRSLNLEEARRSREWTEFDGNLASVWPSNEDFTREAASATRYESWATCPFQYFLSHVLNLTPLEAPEEQFTVSAADRGTLVHRILQRFVSERGFGAAARGMDPQEQARLLGRVVDEECAEFESRAVSGKPAMWRMETRRLKRDLERFVRSDEQAYLDKTGAQPEWTELAFGRGDGALPAAEVELEDGRTVRFRGVIDRVDVSPDGRTAYVLDYKSGSDNGYTGLDKDPVKGGRLLQLPIYARAIEQQYAHAEEIETHYWFVFGKNKDKRRGGKASQFEGPMLGALRVISSGISSGMFPARPGGSDGGPQAKSEWQNCSRCDFDRVCPAWRDRQWERKKGEEGLRAYRELAEGGDA